MKVEKDSKKMKVEKDSKEMKVEKDSKEMIVRQLCLCCQDCEHFVRHYIKSDMFTNNINGFTPICRGHCLKALRRKEIGTNDPACQYFETKEVYV